MIAFNLLSNSTLYAFSDAISDSVNSDYSVFTPSGFKGNADEVMALRHNLQEAQKSGDLEGQLDYTIRIGKYYQNLGINDEALSYFLQALGLSSKNAKEDLVIHIHNSISKVYLDNGMLEKAKEFNNRAVNRINPQIEPLNSGMTYELQARIFFTESKWYKTLEAAGRSLKHYKESGQNDGLLRQWLLMADVYQENELYAKAIKKLNEAEESLDKKTDSELKGRVYLQFAQVFMADKDYTKALQYLDRGLSVAEQS
ncbi:MAG TPA: tetratricopeptide repeat protein, partial [Bacteroidales bacterium]|nr:tetratricopeptide repeat protein [Bacteroidales bacterium]